MKGNRSGRIGSDTVAVVMQEKTMTAKKNSAIPNGADTGRR